jgi:hypothetical protein
MVEEEGELKKTINKAIEEYVGSKQHLICIIDTLIDEAKKEKLKIDEEFERAIENGSPSSTDYEDYTDKLDAWFVKWFGDSEASQDEKTNL